MFTPDAKKIHKFKFVHCKRNSDLFAMYGKRESRSVASEDGQIIPMNQSKIDSIEYLERYDQMQRDIEIQRELERAGTDAESDGKNDNNHSNKD